MLFIESSCNWRTDCSVPQNFPEYCQSSVDSF